MTQNEPLRSGQQDNGKPEKHYQRIIRSKEFIPVVVVLGLVFAILFSSRLAGRPPQIDSITPRTGKPGDVMIIKGRYFGREREGEVRISGITPTTTMYQEWSDTLISVEIPEEAGSGLVHVITKNGKSRGLLFINSEQIPVPASGSSAKPGEPSIDDIQPMAARIGDTITIRGKNFGLEKGGSEAYFTWAAGAQAGAGGSFELADLVPARDYNMDYVSWSDIEIVLKVPDGAASGNLLVTSDKGRSNSKYFEVLGGAGLRRFGNPRKYSVQYSVSVNGVDSSGDNCLYVWMPLIILTPEQRKVQLVSQEPPPMLADYNGTALFALTNLQKGGKYRISLSYMFDRYTVETQVTPSKVPASYDTSAALWKTFTAPDADVHWTGPEVGKALTAMLKGEKNPYLKARRIFEYVVEELSYSQSAKGADPAAILKTKRADAFSFASFTCALMRAAGVPARMVSGYVAGAAGQPARRHFWVEFYVETLGWVPADPLLAKEKTLSPLFSESDVDLKSYYFGNLDNGHITFTKGLGKVSQITPDGRVKREPGLPFLLTIHEESVGALSSYKTQFEDLEVTGTY